MKQWKKLAVHKNIIDVKITESVYDLDESNRRRFTATICGWRNFLLYEGDIYSKDNSDEVLKKIWDRATEIRDKLRSGDESILHVDTKELQIF